MRRFYVKCTAVFRLVFGVNVYSTGSYGELFGKIPAAAGMTVSEQVWYNSRNLKIAALFIA